MRFTIIPDDKTVYVDGQPKYVGDMKWPENVHAIQWYGKYGEIEYKMDEDGYKKPNERFTDLSPYNFYIVAHKIA